MGEVIEFPAFDERHWQHINEQIGAQLRSGGIPEDGVRWILAEAKQRVMAAAVPSGVRPFQKIEIAVTGAEQESLQKAITIGQSLIDGFMVQIYLLVLEIYLSSRVLPPALQQKTPAQILKFERKD
jgi:hypothetical protein